jgi:hypothetical protein
MLGFLFLGIVLNKSRLDQNPTPRKEAVMKKTMIILTIPFIAAFAVCSLLGACNQQAWAETHVQSTMETRSMVLLQVESEELQKWVPESMQIAPFPPGPFKDANLFIIFIDMLLVHDPQGKPIIGGMYRAAVFCVPVKHSKTGEMVYLVIHGLTDNPEYVPGAYKNSKGCSIHRELNHTISGLNAMQGTDTWKFKDSSGALIDFNVRYERALPMRAKPVQKIYSCVEPEFYRIYKTDYLVDVVKSIPANIDRAKEYRLKVSVPELEKLFDGSEQLVGILIIPAYARDVFLP